MTVSLIPDSQHRDGRHIRILTHNIYNITADWERRRPVLIDGLRQLDSDLIALQETTLTPEYDQATDLLDDWYVVVNSAARIPGEWGASIASRWPVRDIHELDQRTFPGVELWCTTLIAEIDAPDPVGPLLFVNHFQSAHVAREHVREQQAVAAARFIEELVAQEERHVILAGDLNAGPESSSVRFLMGRQSLDGMSVCYLNAWDHAHRGEPGDTFTQRSPLVEEAHTVWPYQRLDHILVRFGNSGSPTLGIANCELAFNEPIDGIWPSDHFALVADLSVPAN